MRRAKFMLVIVDVCLIVYWVATAMHLIPPESAFKDYGNEVVQAWNWSFFPLDLLAVAAGCWGVYLTGKGRPDAHLLRGLHGHILLGVLRGLHSRLVGAEYRADACSVLPLQAPRLREGMSRE